MQPIRTTFSRATTSRWAASARRGPVARSILRPPPHASRWASSDSKGTAHDAWVGSKGPATYDLRSDVMTTPTPSMLAAVQSCTLLDDVFQEDPTTLDLEAHVANLAGKEAGLFVLSGTMGNQLALRTHLTQPPYGVLCDGRSHIVRYEAGGVASLTGAMVKTVSPSNGVHLTLDDVRANVALEDDDVHSCPTRVISLENTLNGTIMPLDEARRISDFARSHGIRVHCDGARLWEAAAAGAGALPDLCEPFDTVSLCFSKGLGAPVGSILVGRADALRHCRWVRKSIGGGLRQPGLLTAAARAAVDDTFGPSPDGSAGLLPASHDLARAAASLWTSRGGRLTHPVHTNMCWLDLDAASCLPRRFVDLARRHGLAVLPPRLVLHYQAAQHADDVLARLDGLFESIFSGPADHVPQPGAGAKSMYRT